MSRMKETAKIKKMRRKHVKMQESQRKRLAVKSEIRSNE